jgi:hypothetical protein
MGARSVTGSASWEWSRKGKREEEDVGEGTRLWERKRLRRKMARHGRVRRTRRTRRR